MDMNDTKGTFYDLDRDFWFAAHRCGTTSDVRVQRESYGQNGARNTHVLSDLGHRHAHRLGHGEPQLVIDLLVW